MDGFSLTLGRAGWVRVNAPALEAPLYVRAEPDMASGGWQVGELHVGGGLTVEGLRAIPLARIEHALNEWLVADSLTQHMLKLSKDEIRDAFLPRAALNQLVPEPEGDQTTLLGGGSGPYLAGYENGVAVVEFPAPSLKVTVPTGHRKPDDFYESVASAFMAAAATGPRPAVRVAEANDVPVTTVHRWVKEARRRGVMTPARHATTGKEEQEE